MSIRTMARVWANSRQSGSHLLMLLAIADFADDGGEAFPSVATLADKCRMKMRNAQTILAGLRQSGELDVLESQGPRGTNLYRIVLSEGVQGFAGGGMQVSAGVQRFAGAQDSAPGDAKACVEPLQGLASDPSMNHQEPEERCSAKRSSSSDRGTRLPDDWQPSAADVAYCRSKRPDLVPSQVAENFRDYWHAQPGAKGRKAKWSAVWKTWVRNERQRLHGAATRNPLDAEEQFTPESFGAAA